MRAGWRRSGARAAVSRRPRSPTALLERGRRLPRRKKAAGATARVGETAWLLERARRARGVFKRDLIRTRTGENRARALLHGVKTGRPHKFTPHQRREAIKRRDEDDETLAEDRSQLRRRSGPDFEG